MEKQIIQYDTKELSDAFSNFNNYLAQFGLPSENIIASKNERETVANNLPVFLQSLSPDIKKDAKYLSKFVAGTAIGLFDAALNYVWNEVVLNLRKKAATYGLDLFFDAAIGGKLRDYYKTEEDLQGVKDSVLLNTCRKLELISDIVHKKLTHILTMRNDVAASHPNVEKIGGFELLGWLQTCVKDVLQDQLSESAIQIKALVENLKSAQTVVSDDVVSSMQNAIKNLSLAHANNMLITTFGMFVDVKSSNILRKNISKIAQIIWEAASENVKVNIGVKIDGFKNNLHQSKHKRSIEYLEIVGGLNFQTLSTKIIEVDSLLEQLLSARYEWDNYYNEPPIISMILKYIKNSADIPVEIVQKMAKVILVCRVGKGITYCEGVSPGALPLYDSLLSFYDDNCITWTIISLYNPEVNGLIMNKICQKHLSNILVILKNNAISERLKQAIDFLQNDISKAYIANQNKEFKEITKTHITWK
jgi:hypothetical protein